MIWAPALCAVIVWSVVIVSAGYLGERSRPESICGGTVAALGGLAGWTTYHRISRRRDGLAVFALSACVAQGDGNSPFAILLGKNIIIMSLFGVFTGLTMRLIFKGEGR